MIAAFLISVVAMQAAQPSSAPSPNRDEIVVLAHRLSKVRWEFEARAGVLSKCKIRRTSGSPLIDSLVCKASAQCAAEQPTSSDEGLVPCIKDRVSQLVAAR